MLRYTLFPRFHLPPINVCKAEPTSKVPLLMVDSASLCCTYLCVLITCYCFTSLHKHTVLTLYLCWHATLLLAFHFLHPLEIHWSKSSRVRSRNTCILWLIHFVNALSCHGDLSFKPEVILRLEAHSQSHLERGFRGGQTQPSWSHCRLFLS